jgi:outer membrane receptor protein involved in Fe transport
MNSIKNLIKLLFLTITIFPINSSCQIYTLSGKITDPYQKNLEFITISISQDSTLRYLLFSDSIGHYECNQLAIGQYKISFSCVGLKSLDTIINISKNLNLDCTLNYTSQNLTEVEIKFHKPLLERKSDRLIFNVEQSIFNAGSEVLDLITKIPGLRMQNGNIIMVGKSKVLIMVDDRLIPLSSDDLAAFLNTISTDAIAKIEIITNPPAQYDAQGNSGLINIVTKKAKKQGVFAITRLGIKQATFQTYNTGMNLDYFNKKLRISTTIDGNTGTLQTIGFVNTYYLNQNWEQNHKVVDKTNKLGAKIKLDYDWSDKTKISFLFYHNTTEPNFNELNQINVRSLSLDSLINTQIVSKERKKYNTANFSIQHLLDSSGKKVFIDADWLDLNHNQSSNLASANFLATGQLSTTEKNAITQQKILTLYTLRNEFTLPFKTWELSFGGKLSFLSHLSNVQFYKFAQNEYVLYKPLSDLFKYSEKNQSLYVSVAKEMNQWNLQSGLRFEHTQIKGVSLSNNNQTFYNTYWQLFPTVSFSYQWNDANTLSFNYNKRIDRPNYDLLNPFRHYSTPYSYDVGNPFLKPAFAYNFEIAHTFKSMFNTSLSYRNEIDKYDDFVTLSDSNNIQASTYYNYLTSKSIVLDMSLIFRPHSLIENTTQFSMEYVQTKSNIPETIDALHGNNTSVTSTTEFSFNRKKRFMGGLQMEYQFPFISGLAQATGYFTLDAHLKINIFKEQFQIFLEVDDLFKTARPKYYALFNHIRQNTSFYSDNRFVKLTLKYKIGKEKKEEERKTSNAEELLRIKQ